MSAPHSIEAEQAVLGACLIDPKAFAAVAGLLEPNDFYRECHQDIWQAIRATADRGTDLLLVCQALRSSGKLDAVGGPAYLDSLTSLVATSAHATSYAQIVADRARDRAMLAAGCRLRAIALDEAQTWETKLGSATRAVAHLAGQGAKGGPVHVSEAFNQAATALEATDGAGQADCIQTGFRALDLTTGGLVVGGVTVLAGRTSMGKSAIALEIARRVSLASGVALYWSGEMPGAQLARRLAAAKLGVSPRKVGAGDLRQVGAGVSELAPRLWIDDTRGLTAPQLEARCAALALREPLRLVVVDHLGLLAKAATYEAVSEASRHLLEMAGRLNVAVLSLVQLSRKLETRDDKTPLLSDLRDSGRVEEDACAVLMAHRPYAYGKGDPELLQLWVRKNRDGPTNRPVRLRWIGESAAVSDPLPRIGSRTPEPEAEEADQADLWEDCPL